ncbi:MFS transporter [Amycolatopsis circi]|uniref:MFS transporter n=1 Tax=Amycolatopsis circi TaxID=871959 RepID=UPI000E253115|nr:MFS transporter [Amycolatopsis circi]
MPETTSAPPDASRLPNTRVALRERLAFGVGDLATGLIGVTVAAFLTYFYTDTIGLSAAAVGTIFAVLRIVDAFIDLGVGALVDRTSSRRGKARPWVLWAALPYGVTGFLLFTVPHVAQTWQYVYVIVSYLVMNVFYSAVNVPYGVLNSLITQNQQERSVLNIFRAVFALTGALVISYFAIPTVQAFGGGQSGWIITFAIVALLTAALFWVTFAFTRERVQAVCADRKIPLGPGIRALFRNKYWGLILVLAVINFAYQALIGGVNIYFLQYVVGDISLVGPLSLASIIPVIATMALMAPVVKRFGKRNTAIAGLAISIVGSALLAIDPSNVTILFVAAVVRGIGAAPLTGTFFAMLADTIEYGEWKTGLRTEGLVYSAGSFGTKAGTGLGAAALGWGLAIGGYVGGHKTISESAHSSIVFMYVYLPIIVSAVLGILLSFYTLDKRYPGILADLEARRASADNT